jgi:hypothetical protein
MSDMPLLRALTPGLRPPSSWVQIGSGARLPAAPPVPETALPPAPEKKWYETTGYKVFLGVSGAAAAGVSYARNESIGWAILHGLIGPGYLGYVGFRALQGEDWRHGAPADRSYIGTRKT